MEMESMVAVLKFTSCSGSSSEEEDDREICDDPTATLVIPSPSPTACEREETDSGICGECLRHVELPGWGWGWRGREGICGLSYSHVIARHTVAMTSCFFLGTCEVHRITWLCTCLLFIILSVWYQITPFCGGEPEQAATSEVGSCRAGHTLLTPRTQAPPTLGRACE